MSKTCRHCRQSKRQDAFRKKPNGYVDVCLECDNARRRARYNGSAAESKQPTDIEPPPPPPAEDVVANLVGARTEKATSERLKRDLKAALDELERTKVSLATALGVEQLVASDVPRIEPRERGSALREATFVSLASDWHIEERVDPAVVNGVNEYNLDIARHRVGRYFSGLVYLVRYHGDHFKIRDGVLWLGGDLITGYLREENLEDNELSPTHAIATLQAWLVDGIRYVLEQLPEIEMLRIVCNSGNHGRLTYKVRPSTREKNSIEWLLYHMLAREFAGEPRVQFTLPAGVHTYVQIYDWTVRFTHGDAIKSGGGIGGILIPISKALARWQRVKHAHITMMGHWHHKHDLGDLVINGSLVGYGPFSLEIGAPFEEPKQAFMLFDSKRGKSMPSDIWVTEST